MKTRKALWLLLAWLCGLVAGPSQAATIYTGEIAQGKRVISHLDTSDLPTGTRAFCFKHAMEPHRTPGTVIAVYHLAQPARCDDRAGHARDADPLRQPGDDY